MVSAPFGTTNVTWCDRTWHDVTWHGVAWREMTWHDRTCQDVTWRDVTWRDMTWHGVAWREMTWRGLTWHDVAWRDMTWHDVTWCAMTWHDLTWHEETWHDMTIKLTIKLWTCDVILSWINASVGTIACIVLYVHRYAGSAQTWMTQQASEGRLHTLGCSRSPLQSVVIARLGHLSTSRLAASRLRLWHAWLGPSWRDSEQNRPREREDSGWGTDSVKRRNQPPTCPCRLLNQWTDYWTSPIFNILLQLQFSMNKFYKKAWAMYNFIFKEI